MINYNSYLIIALILLKETVVSDQEDQVDPVDPVDQADPVAQKDLPDLRAPQDLQDLQDPQDVESEWRGKLKWGCSFLNA